MSTETRVYSVIRLPSSHPVHINFVAIELLKDHVAENELTKCLPRQHPKILAVPFIERPRIRDEIASILRPFLWNFIDNIDLSSTIHARSCDFLLLFVLFSSFDLALETALQFCFSRYRRDRFRNNI